MGLMLIYDVEVEGRGGGRIWEKNGCNNRYDSFTGKLS